MTKFIESVKRYKYLYTVGEDIGDEEMQNCWKKASKETRKSVADYQQTFLKRLEAYARFLENNNPSDMDRTKMQEMEFVRNNLPELLERMRRICGGYVLGAENTLRITANSDEAISETTKREILETMTNQDFPQTPVPPVPPKRLRRNAVDDKQYAYTICAVDEHCQTPQDSCLLNKANNFNLRTERCNSDVGSDNLQPNLKMFGLFVATTLNQLPVTKQIIARGKIFDILQNAELEN